MVGSVRQSTFGIVFQADFFCPLAMSVAVKIDFTGRAWQRARRD